MQASELSQISPVPIVVQICQADLLDLNNILISPMECETDSDIELILS